MTITVWT